MQFLDVSLNSPIYGKVIEGVEEPRYDQVYEVTLMLTSDEVTLMLTSEHNGKTKVSEPISTLLHTRMYNSNMTCFTELVN